MTAVTPSVADMILHRYVVARVIWTYMLSIAVTYFITLCLFPGLESEIKNVTLGEWLPIIIMAIFNISDFVGKVCSNTFVDNFIFHKQTNPVSHNERLKLLTSVPQHLTQKPFISMYLLPKYLYGSVV